MAATTENNLRLDLPDNLADDSTWGTILNTLISELERALTGIKTLAFTSSDITLTTDGAADEEARKMILDASGTLVANVNVIVPDEPKVYIVRNATTGAYTMGIKPLAGTALAIPQGETYLVWCDGAGAVEVINAVASGTVATATNALQLGGIVAANYGALGVRNAWTKPQTVTPTHATLTANAYQPSAANDTTVIIDQSEIGASDVTITNPNGTPVDGQVLIFWIEQHATTPVSVIWDTKFIFPDNSNLDLTQTANKVDGFTFQYSTNLTRWQNMGAALNLPRS